jgi:hypothetical protein
VNNSSVLETMMLTARGNGRPLGPAFAGGRVFLCDRIKVDPTADTALL